jgi:hypothetical protein
LPERLVPVGKFTWFPFLLRLLGPAVIPSRSYVRDVAAVLYDQASTDGTDVRAGYDMVARWTGASDRSVRRAINDLVSLGLLHKAFDGTGPGRGKKTGQGGGAPTVWHLTVTADHERLMEAAGWELSWQLGARKFRHATTKNTGLAIEAGVFTPGGASENTGLQGGPVFSAKPQAAAGMAKNPAGKSPGQKHRPGSVKHRPTTEAAYQVRPCPQETVDGSVGDYVPTVDGSVAPGGAAAATEGDPSMTTTHHQDTLIPDLAPVLPTERGTRVPEDLPQRLRADPNLRAWFREHCPHVNGAHEMEQFMDHWRAASGQAASKRDWVATWRKWMRKAEQDAARGNGNGQVGSPAHNGRAQPYQNAPGRSRTADEKGF